MRQVFVFLLCFSSLILFGQYSPEAPYREPDYPKGDFRNPLGITNYLSGSFGELRNNHFHSGIDIKTNQKEGYRVYAAADGYISRINVKPNGYGTALYIDHPNGYTSVYAHLQGFNAEIEAYVRDYQYRNKESMVEIFPEKGELKVFQGDVVALSGNSGGSGGPHLHFEIRDTKTEEPVNPFLFGLDVPDTSEPLINGLYIYPINGDVVGKKTRHQLPSGLVFNTPIYASGKVGMGIKAYDRQNGANNMNGVYQINVYVNDEAYYTYTNERTNFSTSRAINSLTDYVDWTQHKGWVYKLFRKEGDPLQMYSNMKNDGIVDLEEGKTYQIQIDVLDYKENKKTAKFKIIGKTPPVESGTTSGTIFRWDEENRFNQDGLEIIMPAGCLYEDLEFQYKKADNGKHYVQDWNTPVHKNYTIRIDPEGIPAGLLDKLVIKRDYKYRGAWKTAYTPAEYKNGKAEAAVRDFGYFSVDVDDTPPSINPVNIKENSTFTASNGVVRFKIRDTQTGIGGFEGYVNGNWILGYYDQKTNSLTYDLNKEGIGSGSHTFELKVWDGKNNTATYVANFNKN